MNRRETSWMQGWRGATARLGRALALVAVTVAWPEEARSQARRPLALDDFDGIKSVADVATSPDGRWIVYVVEEVDRARDSRSSSLWRVGVAAGEPMRLTQSASKDRRPRFSSDGRFVAFISDRDASAWGLPAEATARGQIFLLPVDGGEAFPVTALAEGVVDYAWAPDGHRLVAVAREPKARSESGRAPAAVVLTQLRHKAGSAYLDGRRQHLYLVALEEALASSGSLRSEPRLLTAGLHDEQEPAWSPDGRRLAFVSNRTPEPEANRNTDIWLLDLASGEVRQLTTDPGGDSSPEWSPDGTTIAYVHTPATPPQYSTPRLMVIPARGGAPKDLTGRFDRGVSRTPNPGGYPRWSRDGRSICVTFADGGRNPLVRIALDGTRSVVHDGDVQQWALTADHAVVLDVAPAAPAEVYTVPLAGGAAPVKRSHANDALLGSLAIRGAEGIEFASADGARIQGWLIKPPDFEPGRKYPLVVWLHGGPVWHWTVGFKLEPQYLASCGYLVLLPNPRGSIGFGEAFSKVLFADWGNKDFDDVMAGVDHLVKQGLADPGRLGVGGWSYGSILTNYIVTKTDRFRAAISGAGHSDLLSSFGTDDARLAWIEEFGFPWDNLELYRRLSPITQVKKVVTPTLFVYGERDFNCSPAQAEQMYVSLKTLGRTTALILYPGEGHRFERPSNLVDRARRYALWFDRYVRGKDCNPVYESWPPALARSSR